MKILPRIACAVVSLGVLAGSALADPYTVRDLVVDKVAATAPQAIAEGRAESRIVGARRLIERLTMQEDLAAAAQPVEFSDIARLYKTIDTQAQEKTFSVAGGVRATGVVAWNYDAKAIREYLDARRIPFVDSQAGLALIAPAAADGVDAATWGGQWFAAGAAPNAPRAPRSDNTLLTPYVASAYYWNRHPSWADVQAETASRGANHAVIAEAYSQGGQYYVRLADLRAGSAESAIGVAGPFRDLAEAQAGTLSALERAWKTASIVRTSGSTSMQVVATFGNITDWVRIRKGLETSRLISGLQIESVSTGGADVSFVFNGRPDQLAQDLRSRGVGLRGTDNGWLLEAISQQ